MGLFGTSAKAMSVPKRECPQCWQHAHDPKAHRGLRGDCPQCVDHMVNGCPGFNRR
ncbi:pRL2-8 [Streptomyces sp. NPDC102406]|uniref:pRL2-8 n=1 Tax=Streptomyces sp. NPDC102406 TaxID=3366171 RepID=UPI0038069B3F